MFRYKFSAQGGGIPPVRILFAVPRRRIRKASQRNPIKRWLREAWRHIKPEIYPQLQNHGLQLDLIVLYNRQGPESFARLQHDLRQAILTLLATQSAFVVSGPKF
jgi:ribonuclease P protein component